MLMQRFVLYESKLWRNIRAGSETIIERYIILKNLNQMKRRHQEVLIIEINENNFISSPN